MNNDTDILEVNDLNSDMIVPVYVSTNGDWPGAILAAAKLERAEIIVQEDRSLTGIIVYSDESGVLSGRWWHHQVQERRRYLGR